MSDNAIRLRDEFAMHAMEGMLANEAKPNGHEPRAEYDGGAGLLAERAYEIADAMMRERGDRIEADRAREKAPAVGPNEVRP